MRDDGRKLKPLKENVFSLSPLVFTLLCYLKLSIALYSIVLKRHKRNQSKPMETTYKDGPNDQRYCTKVLKIFWLFILNAFIRTLWLTKTTNVKTSNNSVNKTLNLSANKNHCISEISKKYWINYRKSSLNWRLGRSQGLDKKVFWSNVEQFFAISLNASKLSDNNVKPSCIDFQLLSGKI